jgi:hypothetical protein
MWTWILVDLLYESPQPSIRNLRLAMSKQLKIGTNAVQKKSWQMKNIRMDENIGE